MPYCDSDTRRREFCSYFIVFGITLNKGRRRRDVSTDLTIEREF
jgi:hypothetical protein